MKFEQQRLGIGTGAVVAAVIVVILIAGAAYFIFVPGTSTSTTTTTSSQATNTTSSTTTATSSSSCTASSASGTIVIPQGAGGTQELNFCPSSATIVIGVNNTVTFSDQDTDAPHNIYFTSVPSGASIATNPSATLMQGDSYSVTLTAPGTYHYECQFHAGWMQGTLTVVSGSGTTTTSSSSTTTTSSSSTTTTTTSSSSSASVAGVTIIMPQGAGSGQNFSPSQITVVVGVNNTVTFSDQDSLAPHNVWFTTIPSGATNPNTANNQQTSYTMLKGNSVTYTLTTPGTYNFECQFHSSWMQGTITVVQAT